MKKVMVLCIVCIVLAAFAAGCATLALSPKDRALLRDFDEVSFTAYDIKAMKERGLDPTRLTPQQKIEIIKDWKGLQSVLLY